MDIVFKLFLRCLFVIILFVLQRHAYAQSNEAYSSTDIIFALADDLTYQDIGGYGSKNVKTPKIDAIAKEGMKFNRCFLVLPKEIPGSKKRNDGR